MRCRPSLLFSFVLLAAVTVGCGGDGGDGKTDGRLAERFSTAAGEARADLVDPGRGSTTCFVVDDEAVDRLSEALGLDEGSAEFDDSAYLSGDAGRETLQCSYFGSGPDAPPPIGFVVSRTDQDLDEYVADVLDNKRPPELLDVDDDALADDVGDVDDNVTGFTLDGFQQAVMVEDGLRVQVGGDEREVDIDQLLAALAVLVDEMDRVIATEPD